MLQKTFDICRSLLSNVSMINHSHDQGKQRSMLLVIGDYVYYQRWYSSYPSLNDRLSSSKKNLHAVHPKKILPSYLLIAPVVSYCCKLVLCNQIFS